MRPRLIGAVLCVVCLSASAHAYVLPVTDIANWLRNQAIRVQTELHAVLQEQQRELIQKMSRRIGEVVGSVRARYGIRHDDPPRWRIHDFESDRFMSAREYLSALNYGDAFGRGFDAVARPIEPIALVPLDVASEARDALVRAYAVIELGDALGRDGAHQSGLVRYNGRSLLAATNALDVDALNDDRNESTTAVLDKLNASVLLELKQKQARNQLLAATLEVALLENVRRRNAEAVSISQRLHHLAHYRSYSRSFFSEAATVAAAAWRQP